MSPVHPDNDASASPSNNLNLTRAGRQPLPASQCGKLFRFPLHIKPLLPGSSSNPLLKEQCDNGEVLRVYRLF